MEGKMIYDEEHYNQVLEVAKSYRNDVERLEKQLTITEKALELACEQIWAMSIWENTKEETIQDNIKFFKAKAKEMMKSE